MAWNEVYHSLNCRNCEAEKLASGKRFNCEVRGPEACPVSAGKAPALTPELWEVINVYTLLTHEFIWKVPALQQGVLDAFVTPKTEDGHKYFYRMLLHLYGIYKEHFPGRTQFPTDLDGNVRSKATV